MLIARQTYPLICVPRIQPSCCLCHIVTLSYRAEKFMPDPSGSACGPKSQSRLMMFTFDIQSVCICGNVSDLTDRRDPGLGDVDSGDASSEAREDSGTDRSDALYRRFTG